MFDIYQTPNAFWLSRSEPLDVAGVVETPPDTVDPSEAEGLLKSFRISNAFLTRVDLEKTSSLKIFFNFFQIYSYIADQSARKLDQSRRLRLAAINLNHHNNPKGER